MAAEDGGGADDGGRGAVDASGTGDASVDAGADGGDGEADASAAEAVDGGASDCTGTPGGSAVEDCAGVCNGPAVVDMCGACDSNPANDCVQDCAGTWGGSAVEDCAGVCNGPAALDMCGTCDSDAENDCVQDCAGDWGGSAVEDCKGVCGGTSICFETPCDEPGAREPLSALAGETCYAFQVHAAGSDAPFEVSSGESYHEFIFAVPWASGDVATRYGVDLAGTTVPYKLLVVEYNTPQEAGTVNAFVTGAILGVGGPLIGMWAAGGCNVVMPDDVGLRLAAPDKKILVQWHMINTTGVDQPVAPSVTYCTVAGPSRAHQAGITMLGTENLNIAAEGESERFGTCINDSGAPIHLLMFWPHMHRLGTNMRTEIRSMDSLSWTPLFDAPFTFMQQVHHVASAPVALPDAGLLRSTCTYFHEAGATVAFGQSRSQEQCYQVAFSYPAGELDNGVLSLIGLPNTCWQFGE